MNIPGIVDVNIGGDGGHRENRPSLVSVSSNSAGTRVSAPFVDVAADKVC